MSQPVLCAPQYASSARKRDASCLDGLLVSYSTLACGFAPTRAVAIPLRFEQAIDLHDAFKPLAALQHKKRPAA